MSATETGARRALKTSRLLNIGISRDSLGELTARSMDAIRERDRSVVFACANPHSLVEACSDAVFEHALNHAEQVVADGVGVTLLGRFAGAALGPRITGTDYFFSILRALQAQGTGRVFFFGSTERVLALIEERLRREFPSLLVCGTLSPPFGHWSAAQNDRMIERINQSRPDVLWVGMTAPRQEKWVQANRDRLEVPLIGSIGAVFDFYAGTHPRAPAWMCNLGLEWLYRLIREPGRMWKRTFLSTPRFIKLVIQRHLLEGERSGDK